MTLRAIREEGCFGSAIYTEDKNIWYSVYPHLENKESKNADEGSSSSEAQHLPGNEWAHWRDSKSPYKLDSTLLVQLAKASSHRLIKRLILSGLGLKEFHNFELFPHVEELDLSGNLLTEIPKIKLEELGKLNLARNRIASVGNSTYSLKNCTRLTWLSLADNLLVHFPVIDIPSLTLIDLSGNIILERFLSPSRKRIAVSPPPLTVLSLCQCRLSSIPKAAQIFINLQSLHLVQNEITETPRCLTVLSQLRTLNLKANRINCLTSPLDRMTSLVKLNLAVNQISDLNPEIISSMTFLRELNLGGNQLKFLPEEMSELQNLRALTVHRNHFEDFPKVLLKLTNLTKLSLGVNKLQEIPSDIDQLKNLTTLNLRSIECKTLPDTFKGLTQLKELDLSFNRFAFLPEELLEMPLRKLDISHNPLRAIPLSSNIQELIWAPNPQTN